MKGKLNSNFISRLNNFTDSLLSVQDGVRDKKTIELIAAAVSKELGHDGR